MNSVIYEGITITIKFITRIIPAVTLLGMSSVALGQELTCEVLDLLAEGTLEMRDTLIEIGTIDENSELDQQLGDLINDLIEISDYEGSLQNQIDDMAAGWEELDGDMLMGGLNGAIASVEYLLDSECN